MNAMIGKKEVDGPVNELLLSNHPKTLRNEHLLLATHRLFANNPPPADPVPAEFSIVVGGQAFSASQHPSYAICLLTYPINN
jgi:hypothetical protein